MEKKIEENGCKIEPTGSLSLPSWKYINRFNHTNKAHQLCSENDHACMYVEIVYISTTSLCNNLKLKSIWGFQTYIGIWYDVLPLLSE